MVSDIRAMIRGYQIEFQLSPSDALRKAVSRILNRAKSNDCGAEMGGDERHMGLGRITLLATVDGRVVID